MLDAGFCNLKLTRGHEPEFELAAHSPRRTVVRYASGGCSLSGDPPGRATSICAAVRGAPCDAPYHLFTRCRVSRPRRLSRARPPVPRGGAPAFAGALRTSTEPATVPPRADRFRVFEARSRPTRNDFMTSDVGRGLRVKDLSAPTPQGSGARRVPLLAGGPEHPLSSPRVRTWLESRVRLGDANPERPRSSFAPPPAKEEAFPKTRVLGTAP